MNRKTFRKEDLDAALRAIGKNLEKPVTCYLIGGAAMTFRDQKVSTKDIDLVVRKRTDLKRLEKAMEAAGFSEVPKLEREYEELDARVVMENPEGMRFDLFEEVVCRKLELTDMMQERAKGYDSFGNLKVRLTSAEDIFLFKGVTDRPDDLEDMSRLATGGLSWDTIKEECLAQESGRNWASHLVAKLEQLEEQFDIAAPIYEDLREWSEVLGMSVPVLKFLNGKARGFEEIRDHLNETFGFTQEGITEELDRLVEFGILRVEKRGEKRFYRES